MIIDGVSIGDNQTFVIAEIGNNHNGCFNRAIQLIDQAIEAGANCVKFQVRNLNALYRERSLQRNGDDLGTEYILDLLDEFELSEQQHVQLKRYCDERNITYLCTPWDEKSIDFLESLNVKAYKVASADFTNVPLLKKLIRTKKPLILSTGMSTEDDLHFINDLLQSEKADYALLHCNSTYPAPYEDINLRWLSSLGKLHHLVGYSGHERGIGVSIGAVALGAKIIERHLTLDRNMDGPDHAASLEFIEFKEMVKGIRELERSLGDGKSRAVSQGEMINKENLSKSLIVNRSISAGTVITSDMIDIKSPGQGLSPRYFEDLVGVKVNRHMEKEDFFYLSDLTGETQKVEAVHFSRPWGIPVRYHDFDKFSKRISPDLYEFHLSYSDMELDIKKHITEVHDCDFVVHAPELFKDSNLMDLASPDEEYRAFSIRETQRVIDITRALKPYFKKAERPMIVANIGGYTMDAPLSQQDKQGYYERFAKSLHQLDCDGVELLPQTMAPFPWHFGGQRYQNLFVLPEEITAWCNELGLRMCFDISHSKLTCNHFGLDFNQFVLDVGRVSAHLHLGDAKGVNGEGLQVGDGDIDFVELAASLKKSCPKASFIPEIWQGHKNEGEGFWIALNKLSGLL
ncbi:N-acetylneuraminate synthase family protein [Aestuariibacter sp. AA17]|uniref:N-acetylneuraminate synthase family protein n=1 Tax=Fluctibacter corallii TaxID=2984329 RepID=A0ABT3A9U6_9ALTE|nr:N-acetylneuraminate synthase family protein [Aestuariibacter sp. AA17]MCV2885443.1 N-acetylneuraminate synthase family protein [Aestuariibacter sp. AA17]